MSKKILYYNWCPIEETEGGGIAVYQRNLLDFFKGEGNNLEISPYFLCSGYYYDKKRQPYIRKEKSKYADNVFSIVNSPVYAPSRSPIDNFQCYLTDKTLYEIMDTFISVNGPFSAIHFQTLEGLSIDVLRLKEKYPDTNFIYSIHNYTLFCPNVMLWSKDEENCFLCKDCDCSKCMSDYQVPSTNTLKISRHLINSNHPKLYYYTRGYKYLSRKLKSRAFSRGDVEQQRIFLAYRKRNIEAINRYVDVVLAVSQQVAHIAITYGIHKEKVQISYIGTKFAEQSVGKSITNVDIKPFGLLYMGYMRTEKGFYFLVDALETLSDELAKEIKVTFASKITDRKAYKRMIKLKERYADIAIFDGYSHEDIPNIIKGQHLGVVPVLWEDNLPQVTIEMIASGIPVLASSFGGASELNHLQDFVFNGGNKQDFEKKLNAILQNRQLLEEYWENCTVLTSMDKHIRELLNYYE